MPNSTCYVPGCKSGCRSCKDRVSVFTPPKDEELFRKWEQAIPRADRKLTRNSVVCAKHFQESEIIRERTVVHEGKVILRYAITPTLQGSAVPSWFPNCPAYVSKPGSPVGNSPKKCADLPKTSNKKRRLEDITVEEFVVENLTTEEVESEACSVPCLSVGQTLTCAETSTSYDIFHNLQMEIDKLIMTNETWAVQCSFASPKYISVAQMMINCQNKPYVSKQLLIMEDMQVQVFVNSKLVKPEDIIPDGFVLKRVEDIQQIVVLLATTQVCDGGPKLKSYPDVVPEKAFADSDGHWRHVKCTLATFGNSKCRHCCTLDKVLQQNVLRQKRATKFKRIVSSGVIKTVLNATRKLKNNQVKTLKKKQLSMQLVRVKMHKLQDEMKALSLECLEDVLNTFNVPSEQKLLIHECCLAAKRRKRGHRYTDDWLLTCLLLHIRSPTGYNLLRNQNIMPLPCISTVRRYLKMMEIKCGFDQHFFRAFKKKMENVDERKRHGILIIDEMKVRKNLTVDSQNLTYAGLADFGQDIDNRDTTRIDNRSLADHGLVFMFRPFFEQWTQPIAVFASNGPTKAITLCKLMLTAIRILEESGVYVDAVVADGAQPNRSVWKQLGISGNASLPCNSFTHPFDDTRKCYAFSDVPHLVKCIRNRLLEADHLQVDDGCVKWAHYVELYNADNNVPGDLRVCPKLTDSHIHPSNTEKMRVKLATQIFSNSVAKAFIFYHGGCLGCSNDIHSTVSFTQTVNDMFDALNCRAPKDGVLYPGNDSWKVLETSLAWLNKWENKVITKEIPAKAFLTPSTSHGLRVTLMSAMQLAEYLTARCGFWYVLTGKFNQDVLERFFGMIRQAGCQNDHPTLPSFLQLYRMLSVYNILRPPKFGNCELGQLTEKPQLSFRDFKDVFKRTGEKKHNAIEALKKRIDGMVEAADWDSPDIVDHDYCKAEVVECIIYYVAGFICKQRSSFTNCDICKTALFTQSAFLSLPEAQLVNIKTRGHLLHPNMHLFQILRATEYYFSRNMLNTNVYDKTIHYVLIEQNLTFPCDEHKCEMLAKIIHYYIILRMRQCSKKYNANLGHLTKEKRKQSKLASS